VVDIQTMGLDPPLSFMTAPPNVEKFAHTRFREPRNLPYQNAPAYKASIYYWWWAFLKRNKAYCYACGQNGRGELARIYADFGNIYDVGFPEWWQGHQAIFAEQPNLIDLRADTTVDDGLFYRIDPRKPFNQIHEEIREIHLRLHAIMPAEDRKPVSSAKYPIYTNVSAHTLHRVLRVWDHKQRQPDLSAYDLGTAAGLKPNLLPPPTHGATRTRTAIDVAAHNKRARGSIANQANRYLRTAAQYIDNVGLGIFPKANRR
jgi:hypothetical protein